MTKGIQIALGATVIAGLLGWYGATNLDAAPAFTYYKTLEDFQANPDAVSGARSRVHGYVSNDSIRRNVDAMQVRFRVQNEPSHLAGETGAPLEVILESLETPDLFKDGAEVVVEGHMIASADGPIFEADKIMAKCPSKFEATPMGSTES